MRPSQSRPTETHETLFGHQNFLSVLSSRSPFSLPLALTTASLNHSLSSLTSFSPHLTSHVSITMSSNLTAAQAAEAGAKAILSIDQGLSLGPFIMASVSSTSFSVVPDESLLSSSFALLPWQYPYLSATSLGPLSCLLSLYVVTAL